MSGCDCPTSKPFFIYVVHKVAGATARFLLVCVSECVLWVRLPNQHHDICTMLYLTGGERVRVRLPNLLLRVRLPNPKKHEVPRPGDGGKTVCTTAQMHV